VTVDRIHVFHPTFELRIIRHQRADRREDVLQQAWVNRAGEVQWRDIPVLETASNLETDFRRIR